MITSTLSLLVVGILLVAVQVAAALPWLISMNPDLLRAKGAALGQRVVVGLGSVAIAGALMAFFIGFSGQDPERMQLLGGAYAFLLHVQLVIDFFVVGFAILL